MSDVSARGDVAVVGLGAIGLPMAVNLARSGVATQVWNRTAGKSAAAVDAGAEERGLADIDAPVVLAVLTDTPELESVLDTGLEEAMRPGDVLVIVSTSDPAAVRAVGSRLEPRGVQVVDAPVSGGDVGAQAGTLSIMVGGEDDAVARCLPILLRVGSTVRHLGPLGSGEVAKLANQIVVGAALAGLGEALNLCRAAGLDLDEVCAVLGGGLAGSRALEVKGPKMVSGDFTPGGAAALHLKDLRYADAYATGLGMPHPLTAELLREYAELVERGDGHLDQSAIALLSALPADDRKGTSP